MEQRFLICALVATALMAASPASAQIAPPRQPRPDWGIFGSGVANTGQKLVLIASFGGGIEDDMTKPTVPVEGVEPGASQVYSGPFGSAGATLQYTVDKESNAGGVQFSAYGRNYRNMTDPFVGTYSASGNWVAGLGKKASVTTTFYAGQYLQNLAPMGYDPGTGWAAPGAPVAPNSPGVVTTGDTYRGFGATVGYSHSLTAKLAFNASYSYYTNDSWSADIDNARYDSQFLSAGLRYGLAKGLGLRAGYGSTIGGFTSEDGSQDYRNRNIDAGVDYSKSLSLTRRSTLSFGTGVSGVLDQADTIHYYLVGFVNFSHELGRTWSAYANVSRGTSFYQTLGQPTISNSASAGVGGLIGRRVDVQGGITAWGGAEVTTGRKAYDSASASASVRVGLNRVLAVNAIYSYYRYLFSDAVVTLPPGFARRSESQSVQISLVVWAPLFTQSRSPHASR